MNQAMNQDELKAAVADAAIAEIKSQLEKDTILGIGTGSTANLFIDRLGPYAITLKARWRALRQAPSALRNWALRCLSSTALAQSLYIDGADEVNANLHMIKGGGAALTREKLWLPVPNALSALPMAQSTCLS